MDGRRNNGAAVSDRQSGTGASRQRQNGPAWLAVIALLANVLVPSALFVTAPGTPTTNIGFCGAAHGKIAPIGGPAVPAAGDHCIFCLVAGVAPGPAPELAAPRLIGTAELLALPIHRASRHVSFAAAQPRGPPAAA
jgi:Protein of unknown function (DUF2946)